MCQHAPSFGNYSYGQTIVETARKINESGKLGDTHCRFAELGADYLRPRWSGFCHRTLRCEKAATVEELLKIHDDATAAALQSIQNTSADVLVNQQWTMRNGDTIYFTMPKIAVLRSFALNHVYHHRGQLTVYLRLLDVPVRGAYGPTADFPS